MKKIFASIICLLFCSYLWASNEVFMYGLPGQSYCFVIDRNSDHYRLNTDTSAFASNVAKAYQAINFTEASGSLDGQFYATFPATIPMGDYSLVYYNSTAAAFDPNFASVGGDRFFWSGSAEITDYTIFEAIDDVNCGGEDPNIIILLNEIIEDINDLKTTRSVPGGH